jgi:hypothetical protein
MAADQTSLPLPPPAPVTASVPAVAPAAMESAPTHTGTAIPSLKDKIAGIVAAGEAATKAAAADVTATDAAPSADPVAAIPDPPAPAQVSEPAKPEELAADQIAALEARFMAALEKQNATLLEQLAKLTAQPAPAPPPVTEPEKPAAAPADRTLLDSPYEAQAKVYFGELPKPLLTQATEAFERRHGWQMELRAAESALQGGDAAARGRVDAANAALVKVQAAFDRIDFDAQLARQAQAKPQPVAQGWGVVARDEVVDGALADRAQWKSEYQALEDHEVAAVLRAVPAGQSVEDFIARATKALDVYVTKKQASAPVPAPAPKPANATQPKNPAPPAPAKPEVTVSGDPWANNQIPSKHEKMQRIISRARGDAMTN